MKFTKDEAFEKLKGILTNNGKKTLRMSERSINKDLETLIPLIADEEMELDAFVEKVKSVFETSNSNVEHDVSEGIQVGIDDWKKKNDHKTVPNKDDKDKHDDHQVGVTQEMLDKIADLERKFQAQEEAKTLSSVKDNLKNAVTAKGVKNKEWIDGVLSIMTITPDMDVDTQADELLKLYNKQQSETEPNVTPKNPSGSGGNDDPFASFKEEIKRQQERQANVI